MRNILLGTAKRSLSFRLAIVLVDVEECLIRGIQIMLRNILID